MRASGFRIQVGSLRELIERSGDSGETGFAETVIIGLWFVGICGDPLADLSAQV